MPVSCPSHAHCQGASRLTVRKPFLYNTQYLDFLHGIRGLGKVSLQLLLQAPDLVIFDVSTEEQGEKEKVNECSLYKSPLSQKAQPPNAIVKLFTFSASFPVPEQRQPGRKED